MNIEIDQDAIAAAINGSATEALKAALSGFQIQNAMAKIVSQEVATGAIARAINAAVAQVDNDALVACLAAEIQRSVTSAVVMILHEGLVEVVCKLRGIGTYGDDIKRREAVKAELLHRRSAT